MAFALKQEPRRAVEDATRAISLATLPADLVRLHIFRAMYHMALCRSDLAFKDTDEAVKADPSDFQTYENRALAVLEAKGDYRAAMSDYDKALELALLEKPPDRNYAAGRVLTSRGEMRLNLGQYELAQSDFESADRYEAQEETHIGLAKIKIFKRDYRGANVEVSHAFSGKPENENALAVLGHIALCEGKEYEAVRHLRDSKNPADLALKGLVTNNIASSLASVNSARSERGCDNRLLLELSGTLFFLQGNIEEARRCFERLMEISSVPTLDWSIYLILENSLGKKSETLVTLRSKCANYPTELWASRLIDLAAGEITIETLVESVQNDEPGFRLQRQGEAYYVASEIALARSDKEAAANYFALATENCVRSSLAYNFARCRLQQIKSGTGKRVD